MSDNPTLRKLSKSNAGPKWCHKAQVFKSGGQWLYACQEGCGGKYIAGASWELMYKIARDHMLKRHKDMDYRSQLITEK